MSFYFYDLETSGVSAKNARIMQFAGQRTDENLQPIGEPDDMYIKLSRDVLPEPDAILITGITPQKTLQDGITEVEFCRYFYEQIALPDTVFVGYNNIRFDDEFLRYTFYRNFFDPYEWHWKDGRSRWDILDVVRMTRALRPEGISWPVGSDGRASNRLELLTASNKIKHDGAHTALADVRATIDVAALVQSKQPRLFSYMLGMRGKAKVKELALMGNPFVYVSGRYEGRYEKLTVAATCKETKDGQGVIVYDLRYDPEKWASKTPAQLSEAMETWSEDASERLPFKIMQYNKCPSIAPLEVLDPKSKERLGIDTKAIDSHFQALKENPNLITEVEKLFEGRKKAFQAALLPDADDPDTKLYDGFINDADKQKGQVLNTAGEKDIADFSPEFSDARLNALFPLFKARNYPKLLTDSERVQWEEHVAQKLFSGGAMQRFASRLAELAAKNSITPDQKYLLEELKLYAESITPAEI